MHLFVDQPKPTPLMLGMDFLKEQRCVIDYDKDLIQFPMQSDCWWPQFVSSRSLNSMPLCGQHWEPPSQTQSQTAPTGNECLEFPDGHVHPPDDVNAGEGGGPADEPVSESLDSCYELSFLSQRQCRLVNQQLRKSDSLMVVCVCALEVCAARGSPLTNTVRQRFHDISSAERWSSHDHDLSKTSGRRSALTNLELVRPDHVVFCPPFSGTNVPISNGRRNDREKYIVHSCSLLVQKYFGDAHVVLECASDSLIPEFLRVTLDTFWRARIDLCMHGLVQLQTHLPIFRSVFVNTSSRVNTFVMSPSFRNCWWTFLCKPWSRPEFLHVMPERNSETMWGIGWSS